MTTPPDSGDRIGLRRILGAVNLALFLISILAIGVAVNFFALQPELRREIDATKTRAYSLSEQTMRLLEGLEGSWSIVLLRAERQADPALTRQIDEVLRRFEESGADLTVQRIDPTDAASPAKFDALIARLHSIYAPLVGRYDAAMDEAEQAFANLQRFAQSQTKDLQALLARLPEETAAEHQLTARFSNLGIVATEGGQVVQLVRAARATTDVQPIPDYEGARSILHLALSEWSRHIDGVALAFETLKARPDLEEDVRRYFTAAGPAYATLAQQLANAADPLARLDPLELSSIGRRIQEGECAVVIGPTRAAAIRSSQLFPALNVRSAADATVAFDQRFRGEQLFASTVRSLQRDSMPMVVFVHTSMQTMLEPADRQVDLAGMKNVLTTARYDVWQWPVARTLTPPEVLRGRAAVWVIVPPSEPPSEANQEAWLRLQTVTRDLINRGEPVLVNMYPSRMARFGQSDAWVDTIGLLGLEADTSRAVVERVRAGGGETMLERGQRVREYAAGHVISEAVDGLESYFTLPVSLSMREDRESGAIVTPLVQVMPAEARWLARDWDASDPAPPSAEQRFGDPLTIAMAIERPRPDTGGRQRCVVVGSGWWMLSYVSDRVYTIGGSRIMLEFPGNYEFMLASLAWLAGLDELIAPSPMSQEVPRLRDVTQADRRRWFWLTVAALPGACVGLGLLTWLVRRF